MRYNNPQRRPKNLFLNKMQKTHGLSNTHERMRLERSQNILNLMNEGMLLNLVLSDEKKFDVQQCLNHQNDRVWSKDWSEEARKVNRRRNPISVMVLAAVTAPAVIFVMISQGMVRASCEAFQGRLESVIKNMGTILNKR